MDISSYEFFMSIRSNSALAPSNLIRVAIFVALLTIGRNSLSYTSRDVPPHEIVQISKYQWDKKTIGDLSLETPVKLERDKEVEQQIAKDNRLAGSLAYGGYDETEGYFLGVIRRDLPAGAFNFDAAVSLIMKSASNAVADKSPRVKVISLKFADLDARQATYDGEVRSKSLFIHRNSELWQIISIADSREYDPLTERVFRSISFSSK